MAMAGPRLLREPRPHLGAGGLHQGAALRRRPAAGERFLDTLRPFVWRKHLDFAAIQDAHDMRLRIRDHKGLGGPFSLDGHDLKLGRGGIREIEFFVQTRQLIAGGRDPSLASGARRGARSGSAPRLGADEAADARPALSPPARVEHRSR
jgi:glutamate-ammonia-ligase adenylyltransferase